MNRKRTALQTSPVTYGNRVGMERLESRCMLAGFQIEILFPDSTLTASQQQAFTDAAARWSQVITGDLPDVTIGGVTIDDIQIAVSARYIDGPSGRLGQAGPTDFRSGPRGLPYMGVMQFDSADVAMMVSQGMFRDVILHEMGHVLGFGSLWQSFGLLRGAGTSDPQFTGANAAREYASLAGTSATSVPVENTGGVGTRDGHWRESVLTTELMTSRPEPAGVRNLLSRVTVGQFQDLGYTVDYAAADAYQLPGTGRVITVADVTVTEGNAGTTQATLTFTLSSASATAVSLQFATHNGSATAADNDYLAASGTVSFAAGQTQKTVTLTISGDRKVESHETFTVALSNAVGARLGRPSATVTIRDDDTPAPTPVPTPPPTPTLPPTATLPPAPTPSQPRLSVADVSIREGTGRVSYATFVITLSSAATQPVLVHYTTADRTARVFEQDYVPAMGGVAFAVGETSKTVSVAVMGDPLAEADETFAFTLLRAVGATIARGTATGTILNDDVAAMQAAFAQLSLQPSASGQKRPSAGR